MRRLFLPILALLFFSSACITEHVSIERPELQDQPDDSDHRAKDSQVDQGDWVNLDIGDAQEQDLVLDSVPPSDGTNEDLAIDGAQTDAAPDLGSNDFPPLGGASFGSGGGATSQQGEPSVTPGGVQYLLIVPASYQNNTPNGLLMVYSGTEGASTMAMNLSGGAADYSGIGDLIFAVLDGVTYRDDPQAGALVLDHLRATYNIDNDRTFLLSESAGTTAGLGLGFSLRQGWFAAFWANDVNATLSPSQSASELGFAPWGNAGPGGAWSAAQSIVDDMRAAGYRISDPAPYDGIGADTHGSTEQFLAALSWFANKSRSP